VKRLRIGLLALVLGCISIGSECVPPEIPWFGGDDDQPMENGCVIELDHQVGFSPFSPYDANQGIDSVKSKFPAECDPDFLVDNTALDAGAIDVDTFMNYISHNIQWSGQGVPVYTYYIVGIERLHGDFGGHSFDLVPGVTFRSGIEDTEDSLIYAFICVEICAGYDAQRASLGASVHELGHSLGRLNHYCLDDEWEWVINAADHDLNDQSCIMGNSFDSECGEPILPNIHFCDSCIVKLKRIKR
jgi:hypothetical protein